jgi:hypothetical protein
MPFSFWKQESQPMSTPTETNRDVRQPPAGPTPSHGAAQGTTNSSNGHGNGNGNGHGVIAPIVREIAPPAKPW